MVGVISETDLGFYDFKSEVNREMLPKIMKTGLSKINNPDLISPYHSVRIRIYEKLATRSIDSRQISAAGGKSANMLMFIQEKILLVMALGPMTLIWFSRTAFLYGTSPIHTSANARTVEVK